MVAVDRPAKRNPLMERQWASLLHRMCNAFRDGDAKPAGIFASVFWIRLYGAITEIYDRFDNWSLTAKSVSETSPYYRWIAANAEVFGACDAMRSALSEDERVYVAFMRNLHAHVYQEGFEYAIEPGKDGTKQKATIRKATMVRPVTTHWGR